MPLTTSPRPSWRSCHHAVTAIAPPSTAAPPEPDEVRLLRRLLARLRELPGE